MWGTPLPLLECLPVSISACLLITLECVCLCIGVKVHPRSVCARECVWKRKKALRLLLNTSCWGPGDHIEASPFPAPANAPLAGGWPWQGLTESWPGGGSMELHASPLSQPTQSVQVYWRLDKHTHTRTHTYISTGPAEAPWACRCPYAPFLCITFLPDFFFSCWFSFLSFCLFLIFICILLYSWPLLPHL